MNNVIIKEGYRIDSELFQFVESEVLPGLGIDSDRFWSGATRILSDFMPINEALLATRVRYQAQIDAFHLAPENHPLDPVRYQQFLRDIGYLVPEPADFQISTEHVDPEVAHVAGPQLVVPLMNARFALNAANARWGSLYDALYGSDVIAASSERAATEAYDPERGRAVQAYGRRFLDQAVPLVQGSHADAVAYRVERQQLVVELSGDISTGLVAPELFVGFNGRAEQPNLVLLRHNGLHIEIQIDRDNLIGQTDAAGVKDLVLEAALTTIQDCEDSIAAVDAADKCLVYRNWLGLMKGDLQATLSKGAQTLVRTLNPDRSYQTPDAGSLTLPGRSLLFIRQVGHLMSTDALLSPEGEPVPEGILDALITCLIAVHDLHGPSQQGNSRSGSIYIVKPKMHGPEEVQFSCDLFSRIEDLLELPANTLKIGIMDEERRTSVNLKACIRVAQQRLVFINTGFLDRTGDEIHTSMLAGPVVRKELMKDEQWIAAYEANNVRVGLLAGLAGKAQIGKGMWAIPDALASMMATKIGHPQAGASCAWVPSPTAATLHALHYHQVDVARVQAELLDQYRSQDQQPPQQGSAASLLASLLTIPLLSDPAALSAAERQEELDNNIQGLLGYVVRWVDQGIGCSKVPDIHDIGRMEDRATLRIASQHICNWLHHGLLSAEQVMLSLKRMAAIVDAQNGHDGNYQPMAPDFAASLAFQAAVDLIFQGQSQPSGYTEPLLHQRRLQVKHKAV